jgi:hypothetical protein
VEEGKEPQLPLFGLDVAEHLRDAAQSTFDRYSELDESVWRSLPFFAAGFGLSATLMQTLFPYLPSLEFRPVAVVSHLILLLSLLSFVWSFRWFWQVTLGRSYEYPSDDTELRLYAANLSDFHSANGLAGEPLYARVKLELVKLEGVQLAEAAQANGQQTRERLKARSQCLRFLTIGFALALANSAIIFVGERLAGRAFVEQSGDRYDGNSRSHAGPKGTGQGDRPTDASASQCGDSGRRNSELESARRCPQEGRILTDQAPQPPVSTPSVPLKSPETPVAPAPQRLEKAVQSPNRR